MTTRDEDEREGLARLVARGMYGPDANSLHPRDLEPKRIDYDVARAILAAGWRSPDPHPNAGADGQLIGLKTVAEYPVTDRRNLDAANMQEIARMALAQHAGKVGKTLSEACEPWGHSVGDPPDWESPLRNVFDAGVTYGLERLASVLDVTRYEPGDGSEDYDCDISKTAENILTAAGYVNGDGDLMRPSDYAAAPQPVERVTVDRELVKALRRGRSLFNAFAMRRLTIGPLATQAQQMAHELNALLARLDREEGE